MARSASAEKETKKQPRQFRRVWWIPVLRGLLFIVLGVLLLLPPMQDIEVTPWLFGGFLAVDGIVLVIQWFTHRKQLGAQWWLVQALVNIAFGAAVLLWGQFWDITAAGQYWLLVVWVLVLGVASIVGAMYLSRNRDLGSSWVAVFGIVSALFGITLITQNVGDLEVVEFTCVVLGLYAFVSGAILMVSGFATRAVAREIDNLRSQAEKAGIELTGGFVLGASGAISTVSQGEARAQHDEPAAAAVVDEPVEEPVDDAPTTPLPAEGGALDGPGDGTDAAPTRRLDTAPPAAGADDGATTFPEGQSEAERGTPGRREGGVPDERHDVEKGVRDDERPDSPLPPA